MKLRISLLLATALLTGACQPTRLSPTVLQPPSPTPTSAAPTKQVKPVSISSKSGATGGEKTVSKVSKTDKLAEAARLAAKRKRIAAARRAQARKLAAASLEAGRQLLREEQNQPALKAFREAVRLNSNSAEAWMGIAFLQERAGNTKDAVEAFKEAKKLWGM